jgi:hypothetical protein
MSMPAANATSKMLPDSPVPDEEPFGSTSIVFPKLTKVILKRREAFSTLGFSM